MEKLILYYLYGFLLIDTVLRFFYGSIEGGFHPGLVIRGIVFVLLIYYFIKENIFEKKINIFGLSLILAVVFFIFQMLLFNIFIKSHVYENAGGIKFIVKIFFMLLMANYVTTNAAVMKPHAINILYTNITIFLVNCIGGYFFGFGFLSYEALEDSYRGFLAGNNSSMLSFISFGFLLYTLRRRPYINSVMLLATASTFFILGTKGIFVVPFLLVMFLIYSFKEGKIKSVLFLIVCVTTLVISSLGIVENLFEQRIMANYYSQLRQSHTMLSDFQDTPLGVIAPGRFQTAQRMLTLQFQDDALYAALLGYGYRGLYDVFGRPAMMDIPMIISFYGILGFLAIYIGIFVVIVRIIRHFDFDWLSAIILSVFLYSSLGGFLMGTASMGTLFAFLLGIKYSEFLSEKMSGANNEAIA
jgi:hypothetical protein